ncbi:MAG TPA: hypothetical protein PLP21_00995 [Pyrinomonadaceae bacterium]|nr:hypothetical protein [Pyrinomonadaceae bacterium]
MIIVEYYIKGESEKHARYFSTRLAARNFCLLLKSDPACAGIRVIS